MICKYLTVCAHPILTTPLCRDDEADSSMLLAESMLPDSIPRTPPNKRASRWRSIHIGSSPLASEPRRGLAIPVLSQGEGHKMAENGHNGGMTILSDIEDGTRNVWPGSSNQGDYVCSVPEAGPEFAAAKFEVSKEYRAFLVPTTTARDKAKGEVDYISGEITRNSLVFEPTLDSSPIRVHPHPVLSQSESLAEEDTQALYAAGAPLSPFDYSLRTAVTDDTTQSIPSAVRNFMDMFDDDGSYPRDFPMELRC